MKSLFVSFYKSFYDFKWLRERKDDSKKSWVYFVFLIVILSIVSIAPLYVAAPPKIKEFRSMISTQLPDFNAEIKDGRLAVTGIDQPYTFSATEDDFILVVDTTEGVNLNSADFTKNNKSFILVDSMKLEIFDNEQGQGKTQYWKSFPNYSIDKNGAIKLIDKFFSPLTLTILMVLFFVIWCVMLFVAKLIGTLIYSLLVLLVCSITKRQFKFQEIFTMAKYAVTLPSILILVIGLFGVNIPLLYSAVMLFMMLMAVFYKNKNEITPVVATNEEQKI